MAGNTGGSPYKITVGLINVGENATTYIDEIQKDLNTISKSLTISPSVKWDEIKRLRSELNGLDKTQVVTLKINDDEIITSLNNINKKLVDTFSKSFNAQTANAGIQRIAAAIATAEKSTKDLSRAAELAESSLEAIGDVANADAASSINKISRSLGKLSDNLKSWSSDTDFMGGINDSLKNVESTVSRISKAFTDNAILVPTKIDIDKSRENFANQRAALTRSLKATGFAVDVAINPKNLAKVKDSDNIADIELTGDLDLTQTINRINTVVSAINADKKALTQIKLVVNQDIIRNTLTNAMEFNSDEFKAKIGSITNEIKVFSDVISNIPRLKDIFSLPKNIDKNIEKASMPQGKTVLDESQLKGLANRLDLIAIGLNAISAKMDSFGRLDDIFRDSNGELVKFSSYLDTIILQMSELMQDSIKTLGFIKTVGDSVGRIKAVPATVVQTAPVAEKPRQNTSPTPRSNKRTQKIVEPAFTSDDTKHAITTVYKLISEYERLIQVKRQAQETSGIDSKEYIAVEKEVDAIKKQIDIKLKSEKLNKDSKNRLGARVDELTKISDSDKAEASAKAEAMAVDALVTKYENLIKAKTEAYNRGGEVHKKNSDVPSVQYDEAKKAVSETKDEIDQRLKVNKLNKESIDLINKRIAAADKAADSSQSKKEITEIYKLTNEYEQLLKVRNKAHLTYGTSTKEYNSAKNNADALREEIESRIKLSKLQSKTAGSLSRRVSDVSISAEADLVEDLITKYERLNIEKAESYRDDRITTHTNLIEEGKLIESQIRKSMELANLNAAKKKELNKRIADSDKKMISSRNEADLENEKRIIEDLIDVYDEYYKTANETRRTLGTSSDEYKVDSQAVKEAKEALKNRLRDSNLNKDIIADYKQRVSLIEEAGFAEECRLKTLERAASIYQDINLKLADAKGKYAGYMEIQNDNVRNTDDFKKLEAQYEYYVSSLKQAKEALESGDVDTFNEIYADISLAEKALKEYKAELKNVASPQTILAKEADKLNEVWRKVAESIDEYGRKLRRIDPTAYDKLITLNKRLAGGNIGLNDAKKQFAELQMSIRRAGLEADNFWRKLAKTTISRLRSNVAGEGWFMMAAAMRDVYRNVVDLDAAMTELKKVTEGTQATYTQFLDDAQVRAKNLGATLVDVVSASADFARLGYSIPDASNLADTAITYLNVGDDVESIDDASKSIISTMQGFNIEAEKSMSIVDRFNEVANNYASSAGDIGEITQRSAAAMKVAGSDLDETIALGVTANEVVQNAETVGTALKTMSMRLRSSKSDMEEAGLDTDGMAESVSKLRDEIKSLSGVDIMLDEDTFKSPYKMLTELGKVWDNLTDVSRANIGELLFGKRQANYCPIVQRCA